MARSGIWSQTENMRLTVKTRLVIGFIIVLLAMVILTLYSVITSQRFLVESVGRTSVYLAEEMMQRIEAIFYHNIEEVQLRSQSILLQSVLSESNQQAEALSDIQGYIEERDKEWVSVPAYTITPFMQELIDNRLSHQFREEFIRFWERKQGYSIFKEAFLSNKYGANVALTGKTTDYRQDDETWWQEAKENRLYIGDIEYQESAKDYGVAIGIRVDDEKGGFSGVIKAIIDIKGIMKEAELIAERYQTTEVKLITAKGRLIYSTKAFRFLEDVTHKDYFKKCCSESNFFISRIAGREKLFSSAHSKGYRGLKNPDWILLVSHDNAEILKPAFDLRNDLAYFSLVFILAGILIAFFISYSITRPISRLRTGTEIIGSGDLEHKVGTKATDEIGQLSRAFDKMTESLKTITVSRNELIKEMAVRKRAEEELEKAYNDLRDTQQSLIRTEKLAALGKLAGMVGHELRNMLGVIRSSVYLLKMKLKETTAYENIRRHLEMLEKETENSDKIIADILTFTRVREPVLSRTQVNEVVKTSLKKVKIPQSIEVITGLGEGLPEISADAVQLEQVFYNIILNAVEAMPEGGRLTVTSIRKGDFIEVDFSDTGKGIPKESLNKIFEPLFTTKAHGIGLGLALCQDIVHGHKGMIEIKSTVGKGTDLIIRLPVAKKAA